MSKNNGNRSKGLGSLKFVDPLAFASSNKPVAPRTTWTLDPANEGVDHINIHSDSNHPLGRWLNPRATQPFPMGSLGSFNTIESYMYFLLANSMSLTEPDVVARVDALRQASSVMLGGATSHLPNDLRQAYAHTYRLPADIYRNIITYVADAYISKIYELATAANVPHILDTEVAQDLLNNQMPYFGYYVSNGVTMNVSQRTTIISAVKEVVARLVQMRTERKRVDGSPMKAALLRAGLVADGTVSLGLKLVDEPTTQAVLDEFRANAEGELSATSYFARGETPCMQIMDEAAFVKRDDLTGLEAVLALSVEETDSETGVTEDDSATAGE